MPSELCRTANNYVDWRLRKTLQEEKAEEIGESCSSLPEPAKS
jgi:hypothetical protein